MFNFDYEDARDEALKEGYLLHALVAFPDCRDPDHPGCKACADEGFDDEEEDDPDLEMEPETEMMMPPSRGSFVTFA